MPTVIFDLMPLFAGFLTTKNQYPDPLLNANYGISAEDDGGGLPDSMGDFLRARDLASVHQETIQFPDCTSQHDWSASFEARIFRLI